jgi:hypothetical protein
VLFVYPYYPMVVFAPFALAGNYAAARAMWMTALEVGLLAIGGMSLVLTRWRPSAFMWAIIMLFAALWYHGVRALINGSAVVIVTALCWALCWRCLPGMIF